MSRPQSDVEGEAPALQSTRGSKVTLERVALLVLCGFLAAALVVIYRVSLDNWRTSRALHTLTEENEALRKNLPETEPCTTVQPTIPQPLSIGGHELCLKCEAGWQQHGGHCYYFSSEKFSWGDSRSFCQHRGGDLVKIDSREEQTFLVRRLRGVMMEAEDKFWIGLTDSKTEGEWLWVDGSPLDTSLTYWSGNEPDNWDNDHPDGEDCVRMGEKAGARDRKCWFDRSCNVPHRSICEKPAGGGHVESVTASVCVQNS